jgi:hypothetical protein
MPFRACSSLYIVCSHNHARCLIVLLLRAYTLLPATRDWKGVLHHARYEKGGQEPLTRHCKVVEWVSKYVLVFRSVVMRTQLGGVSADM